jgi:DNA-binding PadR family transcriptional regulator
VAKSDLPPGLDDEMQKVHMNSFSVEKKFVLRKPQTLYRITETGRQALAEYVQALKQLLGAAIDA